MRFEEEEFNVDALPSSTTIRFYNLALILVLTVYYSGYYLSIGYLKASIGDFYAGLIMVFMLIFLSAVIYWLMPALLIHRKGLAAAENCQLSGLITRVNELADRLKVPYPAIYIEPNARRQHAQVFGFQRKPMLRIDKGLVRVLTRRPDLFDAVVLHELSHILNRDIFYAYAARSLVWASVLLTVPAIGIRGYLFFNALLELPLEWVREASWIVTGTWILQNLWRFLQNIGLFLPFFAIIAIEYARLIRIREHYADWWAGQHGASHTLLAIFSERQKQLPLPHKRFLVKHPSPSERTTFLRTPLTQVCRFSAGDFFLSGLLIVVVGHMISNMQTDFVSLFYANYEEVSSSEQLVKLLSSVDTEIIWAWVVSFLLMLLVAGGFASSLSIIISRYCLGCWLKSLPTRKIIIGALPGLAAGTIGAGVGEFISPRTLAAIDFFEKPLGDAIFYGTSMFCFGVLGLLYFLIIVRVTVPWIQGRRAPRWGTIAICGAGYLLINLSVLVAPLFPWNQYYLAKLTLLYSNTGLEPIALVISDFLSLVGISICLTWLLSRSRRKSTKFDGVPYWLRIGASC
jgi:Zn-dependent protease with chaperone function